MCGEGPRRATALVPPAGFEPAPPAPEAGALSPELRGQGAESSNRALTPRAADDCPYAHAVPRVLLVDDDPAILRLLEVNFRMEGFDVDAAAHGQDAMAAVERATPDVVILDLMLPGMDGREVLARLRAHPATASVPVIFLTARAREDAALVDIGEIYVQKPFDTVDLVATVRALAAGTAP